MQVQHVDEQQHMQHHVEREQGQGPLGRRQPARPAQLAERLAVAERRVARLSRLLEVKAADNLRLVAQAARGGKPKCPASQGEVKAVRSRKGAHARRPFV